MKNTYTSGSVRTLIFKEKNVWYAVALEFNIVESADDLNTVKKYLHDALRAYITVAQSANTGVDVLNQKTTREYEKLWKNAQVGNASIKSPISVYSAESLSLSSI